LAADYPPLSAMQWIGALIMIAGIFCIAINPTKSTKAHKE
jgi:drug/metabolite transporter (DMT)-like permease